MLPLALGVAQHDLEVIARLVRVRVGAWALEVFKALLVDGPDEVAEFAQVQPEGDGGKSCGEGPEDPRGCETGAGGGDELLVKLQGGLQVLLVTTWRWLFLVNSTERPNDQRNDLHKGRPMVKRLFAWAMTFFMTSKMFTSTHSPGAVPR